jgi:hypothetical protein
MADAGFFKGTSAEQDSRFANKQKKLLKQMKFPDNIDVKVTTNIRFFILIIFICLCRLICLKLTWML